MRSDLLLGWVKEEKQNSSRRKLAKKLGLHPSAIEYWEKKGVENLEPPTLEAIALYRNQTLEEICAWLEIPVPDTGHPAGEAIQQLEARIGALEAELKAIKVANRSNQDLQDKVEWLEQQVLILSSHPPNMVDAAKPLVGQSNMHLVRKLVQGALKRLGKSLDDEGVRYFIERTPITLESGKKDVYDFLKGEPYTHDEFDGYFASVASGLNKLLEEAGVETRYKPDDLREACRKDSDGRSEVSPVPAPTSPPESVAKPS